MEYVQDRENDIGDNTNGGWLIQYDLPTVACPKVRHECADCGIGSTVTVAEPQCGH